MNDDVLETFTQLGLRNRTVIEAADWEPIPQDPVEQARALREEI